MNFGIVLYFPRRITWVTEIVIGKHRKQLKVSQVDSSLLPRNLFHVSSSARIERQLIACPVLGLSNINFGVYSYKSKGTSILPCTYVLCSAVSKLKVVWVKVTNFILKDYLDPCCCKGCILLSHMANTQMAKVTKVEDFDDGKAKELTKEENLYKQIEEKGESVVEIGEGEGGEVHKQDNEKLKTVGDLKDQETVDDHKLQEAVNDGKEQETVDDHKEHENVDDHKKQETVDKHKEQEAVDKHKEQEAVDEHKEQENVDDHSKIESTKDSVELKETVPPKSKNQLRKEKRRQLQRQLRNLRKEGKTLQDVDFNPNYRREKRKADDEISDNQDIKKAKLETKALKAKRPGFSEERYNETSYYRENGLRKVYPYYFTFTTFTKGRWVGEKILDVFAKEFRAHPAEEYERCIKSGTLTVNYEKVDVDYRLKHNDLLANIVHRHEVPVTADSIPIVHVDEDVVVVDKPASIPVHPCGRYRHNTVVFILAKEYNLKNLRTIHRLDRLTSGLLLFGRTPRKAREMEQQIRTRQVTKEYVCRVEGEFPKEPVECNEPIEVVSYKIGVCKVAPTGKDCRTEFTRLSCNGRTSVVLCRPHTGRMHQIRVHLQYLGFPIVNDPLYNHTVFGPNKGKGGIVGKTDEQLIQDLIKIHNAENWLGMDGDAEYSMFKGREKTDNDEEGGSQRNTPSPKEKSPVSLDTRAGLASPVSAPSPALVTVTAPQPVDMAPTEIKAFNGCGGEASGIKVSAGTQTGTQRDYSFQPHLMTVDEHCYECKVKYRDPKPKDLVMYLHALKYSGPGWQYETKMPDWAAEDWLGNEEDQ